MKTPNLKTACGLYEIRNVVNGMRYVGSSSKIGGRLDTHKYQLRHNMHGNKLLQYAWNKYGESAFTFKVMVLLEESEKIPTEDRLIKRLLSEGEILYNIASDAYAPGAGRVVSDASREISRLNATRRFADPAARKQVSDTMKKRLADPLVRAKMSAARKEESQRPETIKKKSDAMKAYYANTPGAREKTGQTSRGRVRTQAHREALSVSIKAAYADPARREARSEARRQAWADPIVRARMLEGIAYSKKHGKKEKTARPVPETVVAPSVSVSTVKRIARTRPVQDIPHVPPPKRDSGISYLLTANGETKSLAEWANLAGITVAAMVYRLKSGWTPERAVSTIKPLQPNAKLTMEKAIEIRALYPAKSTVQLARIYGVDKKSILNVLHRKSFDDGETFVKPTDLSGRMIVTSASHMLTVDGVSKPLAVWAKERGIPATTVSERLRAGWSEADAISTGKKDKHNQKLTEPDAIEIRRLYPEVSSGKLAQQFGVSKKSILNVLHRKTFNT